MVIGKLLGHTQPQTTARYAHLAPDPVSETADRVTALIGPAVVPETRKPLAANCNDPPTRSAAE